MWGGVIVSRQRRDPCGDGAVPGLYYFSVSILAVILVFLELPDEYSLSNIESLSDYYKIAKILFVLSVKFFPLFFFLCD